MTDYAVDSHAHVFDPARFGFNDTSATHVPHPKAIGTRQQVPPVNDVLRQSGARVVFDQCGRPDRSRGISQPGFRALSIAGCRMPPAGARDCGKHRSAGSVSGRCKNLN